jgi:sialic acid synthase SpsE
MGIDVIEKHVTHDRRLKGIDHESALNPDELATFVRMIRAVDRSRGSATPRLFSEAERRYRAYSKKSLVATRALEAGHVLAADDVRPMRADRLGVPPVAIATLVGKRLRRPTDALHVIAEADVE